MVNGIGWDTLCPIESNDLEKQDLLGRRRYTTSYREYDERRNMRNKVNYNINRNLDLLTETIQQQDRSEGSSNNKNSPRTERIMLVEDEADTIFLFKMILESDFGLRVDSFNEPFAALYNFRPGLYDLVMIDIVLPRMNGIELYYKIRKLDDKVKICFLTASEMYYEESRKQVHSEAELDTKNYFIRKPIANEDFVQQVQDILSHNSRV